MEQPHPTYSKNLLVSNSFQGIHHPDPTCQQPRPVSIFLPPALLLFQCVTSCLLITYRSMTLQQCSPPPGLSYPKCLPDTISHIISQNSACLKVNSFFFSPNSCLLLLSLHFLHVFPPLLFFCIPHLETRTIVHLAVFQVPEGFLSFSSHSLSLQNR